MRLVYRIIFAISAFVGAIGLMIFIMNIFISPSESMMYIIGMVIAAPSIFVAVKTKSKLKLLQKDHEKEKAAETTVSSQVFTPKTQTPSPKPKKRTRIRTKVAGVTYEGRQELLEEIYYRYRKSEGDESTIAFEEEPDNKYDPNAVKVLLYDEHIGYIPKKDTERVKKMLDKDHTIKWEMNTPDYYDDDDYDDEDEYDDHDRFDGYSVTIRFY